MREWENLSEEEQVYLYWEYCSNKDDMFLKSSDEPISFSEFSKMMQGFTRK